MNGNAIGILRLRSIRNHNDTLRRITLSSFPKKNGLSTLVTGSNSGRDSLHPMTSIDAKQEEVSLKKSTTTSVKYYIPRKLRSGKDDCLYEIDNIYDQRLKRRRRIDPTRELNYTPEHWERHKSVYRRVKHLITTFGSSPFQRLLFPDFFMTSLVAGGLTYYNEIIAIQNEMPQLLWPDGGQGAVAAGTTAIALLTAFRLNASYGRYNEGRKLLGAVNTASRDLAMNSIMWIQSSNDQRQMLNLTKAFSVALTFHLNAKGSHHNLRRNHPTFRDQLYTEYLAEMIDAFGDQEDDPHLIQICHWFRTNENVPLGIASLMRNIISRNTSHDNDDTKYYVHNRELNLHVQTLVQSLGGCERIQKTPIPTCFTRHTSRLLFVWSTVLPFAIYPICGPYFTLPSAIAISYSIMGIEDIGVQLEEPFNILPLRQYADGVYDGVNFIANVSTNVTTDTMERENNANSTKC
jgi:putative membrane protein